MSSLVTGGVGFIDGHLVEYLVLVPYDEADGRGYEDMRRRVPDNALAHRLVGFAPRTTHDEIVLGLAADAGHRAPRVAAPEPVGAA